MPSDRMDDWYDMIVRSFVVVSAVSIDCEGLSLTVSAAFDLTSFHYGSLQYEELFPLGTLFVDAVGAVDESSHTSHPNFSSPRLAATRAGRHPTNIDFQRACR